MDTGTFCISLDFELFWGVRDHRTINSYGENLRNVHVIVPRLLELFKQYNVHCTWATVGILFCNDKEELLKHLPAKLPVYKHERYNPYPHIRDNNLESVYHFAPHLIELISQYNGQEIASHTFSHYYCLEGIQTAQDFEADMQSAIQIAREKNIEIKSLVFPRNQFNDSYLQVCKKLGITSYRGNEHSWLYAAKNRDEENFMRRIARLMDAYINISGHHTYPLQNLTSDALADIPSSRFLRQYDSKVKILDGLRLQRICNSMHYAAKKNELYHLWWHPHNFGADIEQNFSFLEKILKHFSFLQDQYNMQSLTMNEIANQINPAKQ
jgi:peptidoglycan/xylan/chitin deacetylase (PgdA/CDA1 family)